MNPREISIATNPADRILCDDCKVPIGPRDIAVVRHEDRNLCKCHANDRVVSRETD